MLAVTRPVVRFAVPAPGNQDHPGRAGQPADGRGHERRVLLVPAHDDLGAAVSQHVEDLIDLGARDAEDIADAVRRDAFDDPLRATHREYQKS